MYSGRSFDYDAAYMPLLKKIFGSSMASPPSLPAQLEMGASPCEQSADVSEEKESLLRPPRSPNGDDDVKGKM